MISGVGGISPACRAPWGTDTVYPEAVAPTIHHSPPCRSPAPHYLLLTGCPRGCPPPTASWACPSCGPPCAYTAPPGCIGTRSLGAGKGGELKVVVVGSPQLFGAPNLAQLAGMCVFVDMCVFMCMELACSSARVPACKSLYAQPRMCRCVEIYACKHVYPASPPASSSSLLNCRLHQSPGLTSDQELPHPVIVADHYRDRVFTRLHPMQGQGEVGMGTCWNHKQ